MNHVDPSTSSSTSPPRKPTQRRAFHGLAGSPLAQYEREVQTLTTHPIPFIESTLHDGRTIDLPPIVMRSRRGRPRKHADDAAKQAAHRVKMEVAEREALLAAISKRIRNSEHAWQDGQLCTTEGCNVSHHKHVKNVKQGVKALITELEKMPIKELRKIAAEYRVIHDLKGRDRMEGFSGMRGANELETLAQPFRDTLGAGPDASISQGDWSDSQYDIDPEPEPDDSGDTPRKYTIWKDNSAQQAVDEAINRIAVADVCPVCQFAGDIKRHLHEEVNRADAARLRVKGAREILEIATDASFPDSYLAAVREEIKRLTKLSSAKSNPHLAAIKASRKVVALRVPVGEAAPHSPASEQQERHAGESEKAWLDRISSGEIGDSVSR